MDTQNLKDKASALWQQIKPIFWFIFVPIGLVLFYIRGLKETISDLKEKNARTESLDKIKETIHAKEIAGKEADKLESDFIAARDEYLKERKSGLPDDSGKM